LFIGLFLRRHVLSEPDGVRLHRLDGLALVSGVFHRHDQHSNRFPDIFRGFREMAYRLFEQRDRLAVGVLIERQPGRKLAFPAEQNGKSVHRFRDALPGFLGCVAQQRGRRWRRLGHRSGGPYRKLYSRCTKTRLSSLCRTGWRLDSFRQLGICGLWLRAKRQIHLFLENSVQAFLFGFLSRCGLLGRLYRGFGFGLHFFIALLLIGLTFSLVAGLNR
jgi:hypothetical protein